MKWNTMAFAPVALAAAGLAHADTYSVSGSITLADPTFNRPVSFSSLSAVGTAVHYDQLVIIGATPGTYDFRMQAVPGGSFDTFLALYAGGFNAAAPLTNLVAFNDDFTNIASGSGFSFDIAAGVTYTVISTAFSNTPSPRRHRMQTWDQKQPIYQQLADILAAQLLDGDPTDGEAMPSVRALAGRYLLNPLTVNRALQSLGDEGLLENRRGLGLFVTPGARERLKAIERERFLQIEWPRLRERLRRLGIGAEQLNWEQPA